MLAFKLVIHNSILKGDTTYHRVANDNEKKNSCQQFSADIKFNVLIVTDKKSFSKISL